MTVHLGFETRVDAEGVERPWRLVVYNDRMPNSTRAWHGSIPDVVYVRPPRDPVHGNLMRIGPSLADQAAEIASHLSRISAYGIRVAEHHEGLDVVAALRSHGVVITTRDLPIPAPDELVDPHGLGGYAGHDIALLVRMEKDV